MDRYNDNDLEVLRVKSQFHPAAVFRQGQVIIKETGEWATAVHLLLRHLDAEGFPGAPRVIGSGFDVEGRELLTYVEGEFQDMGLWPLEGSAILGKMIRDLHQATASFQPPLNARWYPWFGRSLGESPSIIGHCDVAPWNVVIRDGLPFALIDWEYAGPVDPLIELAQACWLNAKLHDDIVAEREALPSLGIRAQHLRAIVDGYGLSAQERQGFVDKMIDVAICATANEADEAQILPDTKLDQVDDQVLWGFAWRARSAAWMIHHRATLQNALA
ncbi:phosphotransferase [Chloroflexi bacterium TSY]|nr:phosphotransferase [Chloroflexi bacterium TSY]